MQPPTICTFCGHEVVFTSNAEIYGKEYGNGKCYLCRNCMASVGVYNGTTKPLGILATREMRILKRACHELFDHVWKSNQISRSEAYRRLSWIMQIPPADCHFGHFYTDRLMQALSILTNPNWYRI